MPKTKRERILVLVTSLMVIGALLYSNWDQLGIPELFAQSGDSLSKERGQYEKYTKILDGRENIRKQFANLEASYAVKPGLSVEKSFQEQVHETCIRHQFSPGMDPPTVEGIPNVDEYGLIFLHVQGTGQAENAYLLLRELDASGYLMERLRISAIMDQPTVELDFEVARPVKLSEVPTLWAKGRRRGQ